ncbi:hypothetical protein ASPBRDRAFT_205234 [Aspergillus brasiliensis CBS 101740]|uniref:Uncharacterized protein n=1 Tax=Aspergillus brasiliensis (strain CBS 101740 / IMI 381727 / IBT 21946) TaxID=767769 RepID=A0A1L9UU13_ASPBC|nr:hypothetical protein ASPBRDRAFT_205234 [Aspergillus brasiliensis CBS 101740]
MCFSSSSNEPASPGQRGLDDQKHQGQEAVGIMEEAMFLAQLVAEGEWAPAVVVVEEVVEAAEGEAVEEEAVVGEEAEAEAVS